MLFDQVSTFSLEFLRTCVNGILATVLIGKALAHEDTLLNIRSESSRNSFLKATVQLRDEVLTMHGQDHLMELVDEIFFSNFVIV